MPLHDWNEMNRWDGFHTLWITELLRWVKARLPEGYRAYIGTAPRIAIGEPGGQPDVSVRKGPTIPPPAPSPSSGASDLHLAPDAEVTVATIDQLPSLFVAREGWLVAAVELVSPRNKDRFSARAEYTSRYAGYLHGGVHLLLVDLHPRPYAYSFADEIARELHFTQPPLPSPFAIGYRVGEPIAGKGTLISLWQRPFVVGSPLLPIPLPLTVHNEVIVDLEQTYMRAAVDAYLA
jgi:hypothetical protein